MIGVQVMDYRAMTLSLIEQNYEHLLSQLKSFRKDRGKKTILWGTGAVAHVLYQYLRKHGKKIDYFCDNNQKLAGMPITTAGNVICLSPKEVLKMNNVDIYIASTSVDEIMIQIKNSGCLANIITPPVDMLVFISIIFSDLEQYNKKTMLDNVSRLFDVISDDLSHSTIFFKVWGWFVSPEEMKKYCFDNILTTKQYIPDKIIHMNSDATIVDCGAYVGDTLDFFIQHKIQFQKYIAYELDIDNFSTFNKYVESCEKNIVEKIRAFNLGVGDTQCVLPFFSNQYGSFILDDNMNGEFCDISGKIITLDTHLKNCDVSYIKMDIEGFEMSALRGAKKLISEKNPDCAICIYHKATDLWQIPLFLKSCYSDYQIYIRHHANCYFDTVCYAVGEKKDEMEK